MTGKLVVMTGASGSGKTTIARRVEAEAGEWLQVCFFDSVGVPTPEQMVAQHGSGEGWQRAMTLVWMERIATMLQTGRSVLLEGQVRIAFLGEAMQKSAIENATVILVDCDNETRTARLCADREQPELANAQMMDWAAYLRSEAVAAEVQIFDTGKLTVNDAARLVLAKFADFVRAPGR